MRYTDNEAPLMKITFCILAVLLIANRSAAQVKSTEGRTLNLDQKQLENVQIEEEYIGNLFSRLSCDYDIPIGVEVARNEDEHASYKIDFKKGTLSDLLNQFIAEHKQYTWRIENGVLGVFPTDAYRDPLLKELLTTNISSFYIKEMTSTWGFGEAIAATPEIKRIIKRRGVTCDMGYLGGFYIQQLGRHFTLNVSNVTLKSLLDRVITESPVAKSWYIANRTSAKEIFFRVHADLEYSPKDAKTPE